MLAVRIEHNPIGNVSGFPAGAAISNLFSSKSSLFRESTAIIHAQVLNDIFNQLHWQHQTNQLHISAQIDYEAKLIQGIYDTEN